MINLKELRKNKKITLSTLSKDIKVCESTLSNWENGHRQPDIESLIKLADYYDVPIDLLVGRNYKNIIIDNGNLYINKDNIISIITKLNKVNEEYLKNIETYLDGILDTQKILK